MLKRQELNLESHFKINEYCHSKNITFLSTPYDLESVDLLEKIDVSAYKVASTDNQNLINKCSSDVMSFVNDKKIEVVERD